MERETITTSEAAALLGISRPRLLQLIANKQLPAEKGGKIWLLKRSDVKAFKQIERPAHRPKGKK